MTPDPALSLAITERSDGAVIPVRVIPRAGRSAVAGVRDGALLVRLAAAPLKGAANDALLRLLAGSLGVPKTRLTVISGDRARGKRVHVAGAAAADLARQLSTILRGT
jgi:uncharacterized protein YggU (UPF0235/DUF167 family)